MNATRRGFLWLLGALPGIVRGLSSSASVSVVVATDFAALPDGSDAGPGFTKAIFELTRLRGGRLVIPPGIYIFAAESGVALRFAGLGELDIEADGVEFVFRGLVRPFLFHDCRGVRIHGLKIGWARPPFSQGDVEDVETDGKGAVIALDEITPTDGLSLVGAGAIGEYERSSGLIARRGLDICDVVGSVTAIDLRRVRLGLKWGIPLRPASTVVLRHAIYGAHAMEFRDCSDVRVDSVTVHSAPGMAFVGGHCRNVTLKGCVVEPRPGSGLLMSICADAVHFDDCGGEILIEDCRFARMGDDGVNVNSTYWRVAERPDGRTVVATNRAGSAFQPQDTPLAGDVFEFASPSTLEARGEDEIVSAAPTNPSPPVTRETLRFARDLPKETQAGDVVIDRARSPRLTVRNCVFDGNRARGVLAHNDATIENCVFRHQSAQGVLLSPDLFWMEGPEVFNVRIANNVFDDVDRWGLKQGAILVDAVVMGPDGHPRSSTGRPNHDIVIENNEYRNIDGPTVVMRATK